MFYLDSNETPSKFLHEIGPGFTPVITSHGDVNFFEKSFEKALGPVAENCGGFGAETKLPPIKGVPALNSKIKLNSIQLISPPSDPSPVSMNPVPDFNMMQQTNHRMSGESYPSGMNLRKPEGMMDMSQMMRPSHMTNQMYRSGSGGPQMHQVYEGNSSYHGAPAMQDPNPSMMMPMGIPKMGSHSQGSLHTVMPSMVDTPNPMWAASIQQAKASTLEKQLRFQEKNRIAAMKSRQRKKQEWERLQNNEKILSEENRRLKDRIAELEKEVRSLRAAGQPSNQMLS